MIAGLSGAMSVVIAYYHRDLKGGGGQVIDLSLLEPIHSVLGPEAANYRLTGQIKPRVGNGSNTAPTRREPVGRGQTPDARPAPTLAL